MENRPEIERRAFLESGLMSFAMATGALPAFASFPGNARTFRLRETVGLRRFGYPVSIPLPLELTGPNFRLECNGKAIPSQFRPVKGLKGQGGVILDFVASPGPLETELYVLQSGEGIDPGPEVSKGMSVGHERDRFFVSNGASLSYSIPETLDEFFTSVRNANLEFFSNGLDEIILPDLLNGKREPGLRRNRSYGFFVEGSGNSVGNVLPWKGTISRAGPLAIGLQFLGQTKFEKGKSVTSVLDLTFPSSKSWVEASWTVDDPEGIVSRVGVDLHLLVEGARTLIDLGASNTVYGQIGSNEVMTLEAGADLDKAWVVRKGGPGRPLVFASATSKNAPPSEGWAHIMDSQRCTALAVEGFGRETRDTISVRGDGRIQFDRRYSSPRKASRNLRFWLHFVSNPVQVGAATSPQAILAPLKIEWV